MACPFRYRSRQHFSLGADPDFVMWSIERDAEAEREFDRLYPTCWVKFLHWLGLR